MGGGGGGGGYICTIKCVEVMLLKHVILSMFDIIISMILQY